MIDAQPPARAVRALARWRRRPADSARLAIASGASRILILKPHDQLGDFVLATPAIHALRERFPEARIALITREFLAPLATRVRGLDQVWVVPRIADARSLVHFFATLAAVSRFRPDVAFVMNSVSRSKSADAFALWSGARLVVGRHRVGAGGPPDDDAPDEPGAKALARPATDPLYDLDVEIGRLSRAQVERLLDLVRWCTGPTANLRPRLDLSDADRALGQARLAQALRAFTDDAPAARIVGLHPGAANELKCWPMESFVALGVGLVEASPIRLVAFDSPRERGRAAAVVAGLAAHGVVAGLVPALGIEAFAATCAHLDLLVCNDSGVMHIAAAVGVPTLSFHSLGNPVEWAPRTDRSIAFYAPQGIGAIPVEPAIEAARALLALTARS